MPTRRWAGLVLFGLLVPSLAAQPPREGGLLPEPRVGQPVTELTIRGEPFDPFQYPLSVEQKKLLAEIVRLGGSATISATPEPDGGDVDKPPKWGPVYSSASIEALDDEFGKKLAALLPLLKQLPNLRSLGVAAIEITEADLRQLGQLREAKGLRTVFVGFRRLPANAKWLLRQELPQLPPEPLDWFHDQRWHYLPRVIGHGNLADPESVEPSIRLTKLSALTEIRPRSIEPAASPRRRLQVERYNVAIEWHRINWRLFNAGQSGVTFEYLKAAHEALLRSALDLCETPADRVRVWELYVESMTEYQQIVRVRMEAGLRGAFAEYYHGQTADLLAAKLELLKARQAAEKRP